MKINKVHLLFEQSGTFKRAFLASGIPAFDYDILNDFGETDFIIDLFAEIEKAFNDEKSVFDTFTPDDLIFAFSLAFDLKIKQCYFSAVKLINYRINR